MSLTILSVAYPLAPVSRDAAGGAEQVLASLDRALVRAGHRSLVLAQEGSAVAGTLVAVPRTEGALDDQAVAGARERHRLALRAILARERVDVVHLHGIDFASYLPPPGPPVLATLHLPVSWYGEEALNPSRPDTWLHCVSDAQHRDAGSNPFVLPPIPNGVDVESFGVRHRRGGFALLLGRICPEKGVHVAIAAARKARVPLAIAGPVFPYPAHQDYFEREVAPHLGRECRYLGPVGFRAKRRLLASARCLLVPALAPETSSLVVREAAASGTPAIAFSAGALAESVLHGTSGFLVASADEMADAISRVAAIDPDACRSVARTRFAVADTVRAYLARYADLASGRVARAA